MNVCCNVFRCESGFRCIHAFEAGTTPRIELVAAASAGGGTSVHPVHLFIASATATSCIFLAFLNIIENVSLDTSVGCSLTTWFVNQPFWLQPELLKFQPVHFISAHFNTLCMCCSQHPQPFISNPAHNFSSCSCIGSTFSSVAFFLGDPHPCHGFRRQHEGQGLCICMLLFAIHTPMLSDGIAHRML